MKTNAVRMTFVLGGIAVSLVGCGSTPTVTVTATPTSTASSSATTVVTFDQGSMTTVANKTFPLVSGDYRGCTPLSGCPLDQKAKDRFALLTANAQKATKACPGGVAQVGCEPGVTNTIDRLGPGPFDGDARTISNDTATGVSTVSFTTSGSASGMFYLHLSNQGGQTLIDDIRCGATDSEATSLYAGGSDATDPPACQ
jgi:hypothetical protein